MEVRDSEIENILHRLRVDAGSRTIAELTADRAIALNLIERLKVQRQRNVATRQPSQSEVSDRQQSKPLIQARNPGALLRLKDIRQHLGVSASTIYRWVSEGQFPKPVHLSHRMARWRVEDLDAWRIAIDTR